MSLLSERPLVLLVEDDRDGRLLFAEWLEGAGFRVEQAHNGLQALERAFDLLPDAILTDLNIPGIDGYELTRRLSTIRARVDPHPRGHRLRAVHAGSRARRRAGLRRHSPQALRSGRPRADPEGAHHGGPRPAFRLTHRWLPS